MSCVVKVAQVGSVVEESVETGGDEGEEDVLYAYALLYFLFGFEIGSLLFGSVGLFFEGTGVEGLIKAG